MSNKNPSSKGRKKKSKKALAAAPWEGWNDYFMSEAGIANIINLINGIAAAVHGKYSWLHPSYRPRGAHPVITETTPGGVAVEMIRLDPRLAAFLPESAASQIGDLRAAVALVNLRDQDGPPDEYEEIRNAVCAAVALMSHGVTRVVAAYTGGNDQADLTGTSIYCVKRGFKCIAPEDFQNAESKMSDAKAEALCKTFGITPNFFYGSFCEDGGDGSLQYKASYVASFMPGFRMHETEHENEPCWLCERAYNDCTCVEDEETGDLFTREDWEAREKEKAEENKTGAQS
jgi:hypothetical protein